MRLRLWNTYAIGIVQLQLVKVGRAISVPQRLRTLQIASPFELTVLGVIEGDPEHDTHRRLDLVSARMRGEWFRLNTASRGVLFAIGLLEEP